MKKDILVILDISGTWMVEGGVKTNRMSLARLEKKYPSKILKLPVSFFSCACVDVGRSTKPSRMKS